MVRLRRGSEESLADFMARYGSTIKEIKQADNFKEFDQVYFQSVFNWGGHVARMVHYDAQRLTHRVLHHKLWRKVQDIAVEHDGDQLHGRVLRIWRWEHILYSFFRQASWTEVAQNQTKWSEAYTKYLVAKCKSKSP